METFTCNGRDSKEALEVSLPWRKRYHLLNYMNVILEFQDLRYPFKNEKMKKIPFIRLDSVDKVHKSTKYDINAMEFCLNRLFAKCLLVTMQDCFRLTLIFPCGLSMKQLIWHDTYEQTHTHTHRNMKVWNFALCQLEIVRRFRSKLTI